MDIEKILKRITYDSTDNLKNIGFNGKIFSNFLLENTSAKISNKTSSIIMLSGGIDSTTLLYLAKKLGNNPTGLEFYYEGKPRQESCLIEKITDFKNVDYFKIKYPDIYDPKGLKSDFSESNSFYYTIAAAFAYERKINYILAGQILDDWVSSDTKEASPEFYNNLNNMLKVEYGIDSPEVLSPFIYLTKKQVVDIGKFLDVPFEYTRSCIMDLDKPCGECEQCIDRQKVLF